MRAFCGGLCYNKRKTYKNGTAVKETRDTMTTQPPKKRRDPLRYAANLIGGSIIVYLCTVLLLRWLTAKFITVFNVNATMENPINVPAFILPLALLITTCAALWLAQRFIGGLATASLRPQISFADPKDVRLWLFVPVFMGVSILCDLMTNGLATLLETYTNYTPPTAVVLPEGVLAMLLYFLATCVAPAYFEEVWCRGMMQGVLRRWGMWCSVTVTSMAFALLHNDLASVPAIFILSVLLGLVAHATNSLLPCVVIHFCNNTLSFLFLCINQKMDANTAAGVAVFALCVVLTAAVGCGVLIHNKRLLATLRPIPYKHDPRNRENRVQRLATSPLYIIVMVLLAVNVLLPLVLEPAA